MADGARGNLIRIFEKDLGEHPNMLNFSQPIATRVDELLSGVKAQIAVKLFGEDPKSLRKGEGDRVVIKTFPAHPMSRRTDKRETQLVVRRP